MSRIKEAYYYLFYKLYKFSEAAPSKWLSDWKATITIVALEIFLVLSFGVYYAVTTKKIVELSFKMPIVFIPFILILLINYIAFIHTDEWKMYVREFDKLSKKRNRIGGIIVWTTIFFIIINLIFSFYLMSQIDWKQYR